MPAIAEEVRAAAHRIAPYVRETPLEPSHALSEATGRDCWVKLENLQHTGSFKLRGALNRLHVHRAGYPPFARRGGVLAHTGKGLAAVT